MLEPLLQREESGREAPQTRSPAVRLKAAGCGPAAQEAWPRAVLALWNAQGRLEAGDGPRQEAVPS